MKATRATEAGDNPAAWRGHLDQLLPKPGAVAKVENHAALDWRDLPAFMPQLRAMPGAGAMLVELCNQRGHQRRRDADCSREGHGVITVPALMVGERIVKSGTFLP